MPKDQAAFFVCNLFLILRTFCKFKLILLLIEWVVLVDTAKLCLVPIH